MKYIITAIVAAAAFVLIPYAAFADTDRASPKVKDDGVVIGVDGKPQEVDVDDTVGDKETEKPSTDGNATDGYGWDK